MKKKDFLKLKIGDLVSANPHDSVVVEFFSYPIIDKNDKYVLLNMGKYGNKRRDRKEIYNA